MQAEPYNAEISRENPGCFLFLIDQSASMADPFGGGGKATKAEGLADAVNRLLQNLVLRCSKEEGIRYYYDVGVIGYGGSKEGSIFGGSLAGQELVSIGEVADNPIRVELRKKEDGAGGLIDFMMPIWFDPEAHGGTPMREALGRAHALLAKWVSVHPDSYPPIVINLTDGESTDGDPSSPADAVKGLATGYGNVLLFNCHISSRRGNPILFPEDEQEMPDKFAKLMFRMSSVLPSGILEAAKEEGFKVGAEARGCAFNAELLDLLRFLDIGTRQTTNLR